MGLFSPKRNPDNPKQQVIAAHELGHAWAWRDAGFSIQEIVHSGDGGWAAVRENVDSDLPQQRLLGYAVGCWAGWEAEVRYSREIGRSVGFRGHCSHDISNFKWACHHLDKRLSEGKARSLARAAIGRHWSQITRQVPVLIDKGRMSI